MRLRRLAAGLGCGWPNLVPRAGSGVRSGRFRRPGTGNGHRRPRRPAGRVLPPLAAPHLRAVSLRGGRSVPPGPGFRLTPLRTQGNPPGERLPWTATDGIAAHCGRIWSRERLVASDRVAFGVPGPETVSRPRRPAGPGLPPLAAPHLRAVSLRGGRNVPPGPGFRLPPLRTQGNPPARAPVAAPGAAVRACSGAVAESGPASGLWRPSARFRRPGSGIGHPAAAPGRARVAAPRRTSPPGGFLAWWTQRAPWARIQASCVADARKPPFGARARGPASGVRGGWRGDAVREGQPTSGQCCISMKRE